MVLIMWCREWANTLRMCNSPKAWTLASRLEDAELFCILRRLFWSSWSLWVKDTFFQMGVWMSGSPDQCLGLPIRDSDLMSQGPRNFFFFFLGDSVSQIWEPAYQWQIQGSSSHPWGEFCLHVCSSWPWTLSNPNNAHVFGLHSSLCPFPKCVF